LERRDADRPDRSVDVTLALDFLLADAVRFIPVQLSQPNVSVVETNPGDSFHLPPAALPVQPPQPRQFPDSLACRDDPKVRDVAKDGGEVSQILGSLGTSPGARRTPALSRRGDSRYDPWVPFDEAGDTFAVRPASPHNDRDEPPPGRAFATTNPRFHLTGGVQIPFVRRRSLVGNDVLDDVPEAERDHEGEHTRPQPARQVLRDTEVADGIGVLVVIK
jgi:hypothetical protein